VLAAGADGGDDVLHAARQHHPDRHLPVVGRIGRVGGARAAVEAHLAGERPAQRRFEAVAVGHLTWGVAGSTLPDASPQRSTFNAFNGEKKMKYTATRIICRLMIALMIWTPFQVAQAGMIGTDAVVVTVSQADRAALVNLLTRSDVASQLASLGIDAATAKDRVAALTDQEVQSLTGRINSLPAGADAAGLLLLVLIVLAVWWLWKR
jgi:hypothetical protein